MPERHLDWRFRSGHEAFLFANFLRERVQQVNHQVTIGGSCLDGLFCQGAQTQIDTERIGEWRDWYRWAERGIQEHETPSPEYEAGEKQVLDLLHERLGQSVSGLDAPLAAVEGEFSLILIEAIEMGSDKLSQFSRRPLNDWMRIARRVGGGDPLRSLEAVEEIIAGMVGAGAMPVAPFAAQGMAQGMRR